MTEFADYVAPEVGDTFIAKDNIDHVIVVRPIEHKTGVVTANSPNGTDAVSAHVLDLDAPSGPATYRDVLLFGGAMVDGFKNYIGQTVVVKIEKRQSKSGRSYPAPVGVGEDQKARAKQAFAAGDPFAPDITTTQSVGAVAPF